MPLSSHQKLCPCTVLLLVIVRARPIPLQAQAENDWIGKRVITEYATVLELGNQIVDDE